MPCPNHLLIRGDQLIDTQRSVSVVIPVYNSEATLRDLHCSVVAALSPLTATLEIIFVEDCGGDGSWKVIEDLAATYPTVRGIKLARNYGQHNALLCGIRAARHEVIVTLDDDLQHPPEEIPKLLTLLNQGQEVVYGTPRQEPHGLWRGVASRITKLALANIMGAETARKVSSFRAFEKRIREAFAQYRGPFVSIDVLLTWGASRFAAVPVRHDQRRAGSSNYSLRKLINHAFNMMTGFSVMPLQVASVIGFVFTFLGGCLLIYVVGRYMLEGTSVPGFPFLASIIAIFSGAQLFAIGVIGEYLARMHFRTMDRPPYVVSKEIKQRQPRE